MENHLQDLILKDSGKELEKRMKIVKIRNLLIGEGRPKICVPLMGDREAVLRTAEGIKNGHADLAEWRMDTDPDVKDEKAVIRTAKKLRETLGELPILFTFRSREEGGSAELTEERYQSLNESVICSGLADLVDIEFFKDRQVVDDLIFMARKKNVRTVLSSHDFQKTPSEEEIVNRLCAMQKAGADLAKIAVMPQSEEDVVRLLNATWKMKTRHQDTPVITMSMGAAGVPSRICGELFGSAVTFAAYEKASAPGQLQLEEAYEILEKLHV